MDTNEVTKIALGQKVKDSLTSFEGTAVGVAHYLHSNTMIAVVSPELKDFKPIDYQWFNVARLEVIENFSTNEDS